MYIWENTLSNDQNRPFCEENSGSKLIRALFRKNIAKASSQSKVCWIVVQKFKGQSGFESKSMNPMVQINNNNKKRQTEMYIWENPLLRTQKQVFYEEKAGSILIIEISRKNIARAPPR